MKPTARMFVVWRHSYSGSWECDVEELFMHVECYERDGIVRWKLAGRDGRTVAIFEAPSLKIYDPWSGRLTFEILPDGDVVEYRQERSEAIEMFVEILRRDEYGDEKNDHQDTGGAEERAQADRGGSGQDVQRGGGFGSEVVRSAVQGG